MKMIKMLAVAGLLFAAASGCHTKSGKTTPTSRGDTSQEPPQYPPAQQ